MRNDSHLEVYDIENKLKLTTQPVISRPVRVANGVLPVLSKESGSREGPALVIPRGDLLC